MRPSLATRITLAPGATYRGPFQLRRKDGDGWIVIASAAKDLPAAGHARGSVGCAEDAEDRRRVRLLGVRRRSRRASLPARRPRDRAGRRQVARRTWSSWAATSAESKRCRITSSSTAATCMAIARKARGAVSSLNASHVAVVDSYLSDFKERTRRCAGDRRAGTVPGRSASRATTSRRPARTSCSAAPIRRFRTWCPSDIEIVRNHMAKPLRWKKDDPSFEGTEWAVKNLFELKNARRVLVDGNLLEYNWPHAQNGFAILFTVRNQDGGAPWSVVEDVTFSNNVVRHVGGGINILGRDDNHPSQQTRRIAIRNNVFLDVGGTLGQRPAVPAARRHARRRDRPQHRVSDRQPALRRRPRAAHRVRLRRERRAAQRVRDYRFGHRVRATRRWTSSSRGAVFRGNVIVGGNPDNYPPNNVFLRRSTRSARRHLSMAQSLPCPS